MRYLAILLIIVFTLASCSSGVTNKPTSTPTPTGGIQETEQPTESPEQSEEPSETIDVDKNLLTVDITFPASMVGEDPVVDPDEDGVKGVKQNADGSVTITMTKDKYNGMMEEAKSSTIEFLDNIAAGTDFASVKNVTYNNDFSKICLEVNREEYENSMDAFVTLGIAVTVGFYKVFEGKADYKITLEIKDIDTGEIFNKATLPDDLK